MEKVNDTEREKKLRRLRMYSDGTCTTLDIMRKRPDLADFPLLQQIYEYSPEQLKKFKKEYCRFSCTHFEDTCPKVDSAIEEAEIIEEEKALHFNRRVL